MSELEEIVLIKKISQTTRYLIKLMNDELTDSQDENFIKLIQEEIVFYKNKLKELFILMYHSI
jgi:hypothetical protein